MIIPVNSRTFTAVVTGYSIIGVLRLVFPTKSLYGLPPPGWSTGWPGGSRSFFPEVGISQCAGASLG